MIQNKRIKKRNRLIRRLFYKLSRQEVNKKVYRLIRFSIKDYGIKSSYVESKWRDNKLTGGKLYCKIKIVLNIYDIEYFSQKGIDNDYYNTRRDLLNPLIYKNRHNAIRFILLHELYHVKARLRGIDTPHNDKLEEVKADRWAIDKIRGI